MKTLKNLLWISTMLMCITSCSKEEMLEKNTEIPEGKISVTTEVTVDGVVQTDTRAASEAGYTTGDGLYDGGDPVTVAAFANEGYELVRFYDKSMDSKYQGKSSYEFNASIPQTFKAEFAKKYAIDVSASPADGGTVTGGGAYGNGKTCTLVASANTGYEFSGWYEGSTKVSSSTSYSFTVSSNRTITGKFEKETPQNAILSIHWRPKGLINDLHLNYGVHSYLFRMAGIPPASFTYYDIINDTDQPLPWKAGNYPLDSYEIMIGDAILKNPYWDNLSMCDHGIVNLNGHRFHVKTRARLSTNGQVLAGKLYELYIEMSVDDAVYDE